MMVTVLDSDEQDIPCSQWFHILLGDMTSKQEKNNNKKKTKIHSLLIGPRRDQVLKRGIIKEINCFEEADLSRMHKEDLFNKVIFEMRTELWDGTTPDAKIWGEKGPTGGNICTKSLIQWTGEYFEEQTEASCGWSREGRGEREELSLERWAGPVPVFITSGALKPVVRELILQFCEPVAKHIPDYKLNHINLKLSKLHLRQRL